MTGKVEKVMVKVRKENPKEMQVQARIAKEREKVRAKDVGIVETQGITGHSAGNKAAERQVQDQPIPSRKGTKDTEKAVGRKAEEKDRKAEKEEIEAKICGRRKSSSSSMEEETMTNPRRS